MKNLFKLLFGKVSEPRELSKTQNPWVKEGDFIYLHTKTGLYLVTSVNADGFFAVRENAGKNQQPELFPWNEFRRWSSRTSSRQDK